MCIFHFQSIINTINVEGPPSKLKVFNRVINDFAGNPEDLFLRTNPKEFLFDGIDFNCQGDFLLKRTCIEIMNKAPEQIKEVEKGVRLRFSLLHYVSVKSN